MLVIQFELQREICICIIKLERTLLVINKGLITLNSAITGKNDYLLYHLAEAINKAERIRFNVAFLMESGAKLISPYLEKAAEKGAIIQVLTGRYMGVTEPSAIYFLLHRLGKRIDIRFYSGTVQAFHPKAYLFDYPEEAEVFIGSSNISQLALTNGLEWNYRFSSRQNRKAYEKFSETFDALFYNSSEVITHEVLRKYTINWKKPPQIKFEQKLEKEYQEEQGITPRGAQIEALYELEKAREEGVDKGLVVAATGVGKTYLAAFDSCNFEKVLFLAHREEILSQARNSFLAVRPGARAGFLTGAVKESNNDLYFATVQTLSRENNLKNFSEGFFNYIVVDEFHHAAANSYLTVINYFNPDFLLGLTATPFRTDNRDIFVLCGDNVIYELYLKDAIDRDLLVPFRYYGIHDATDYSQVEYRSGKYVIEDLERELSRAQRADLVLKKYKKFAGRRALGFCASIKHADFMAEYFNKKKIPAASVHSGSAVNGYQMERKEAVEALENEKMKVLFVVDIFNEGVDIPSVDTVLFLRPTESFVVFLQQLGRGLRKDDGKSYLTVLDFIGNYKRAHYIPSLLAGDNPRNPRDSLGKQATELEYPVDCQVHFDFQLLDLFERMSQSDPLRKRMKEDFFRLKEYLGRRPTRVDIFEGSDIPSREFLREGWLRFLHELEELEIEEEKWLGTIAEEFLIELERTRMTKAYKIPTLSALLGKDTIRKAATLSEIGENMADFYRKSPLHQKDLRGKSTTNWKSWETNQFEKLAKKNPVHFLSKARFFNYDEVNKAFYLSDELEPFLTFRLSEHVKDILEYRRLFYFSKRFKEEGH